MRVRALLQQPALALEFGDHGLVRLVEQAQPVEPRDAGDRAGTQRGERDHELADHTWSRGLRAGPRLNNDSVHSSADRAGPERGEHVGIPFI